MRLFEWHEVFTEDTVINGKQVLPSALVDDIKRLAEAPSRNISMVF